ncbi:helix-turn-helix domain-containing protein [Nonomuraea angiospora]|uniref:Transcriptional regulator YheO n=1 Tax=Nonomuraea angiospora TaxID=46172 RepID=A0ABR9LSL6_9ACTN|nr:helix-turn-helix domain-containing protein [Nonomuraea angiospora]MBE1583655.1 putative transcriptional regulator YheO [Nonomuraea angiospora]
MASGVDGRLHAGAVDQAAQRLNVSRFTVCNYLNELQAETVE